jgi:NAD(P)-dependent dehydrogenase (short-subunit alcohol dehydrogenase family)
MSQWTITDMGDHRDRVALVTGGNTGLGLATAQALAVRGARVVLACRDLDKARAAADQVPGAAVLHLDLGSLASVRAAVEEFRGRYDRLDLLINNAGLMIPPYGRTADGFESQFGVNHLGHFALTGLLLDRLTGTPESRVVTVSSHAQRRGRIDFDDLQSARRYDRMTAYAQSKLANLMFTYELQRRLTAAGADTIAVAAHPGGARTDLMRHSPPLFRFVASRRTKWLFSWLIQDREAGALPTLRAATDPNVRGGEYYGPSGWREFTGRSAVLVESTPLSHDVEQRRRLWQVSEELTDVVFPLPATAAS